MKAFLCHSSKDSGFTIELASHIRRCLDDVFYYEEYQAGNTSFQTTISVAIADCEVMIIVLGRTLSPWQVAEAQAAHNLHMGGMVRSFFLVQLPEASGRPAPVPKALWLLFA